MTLHEVVDRMVAFVRNVAPPPPEVGYSWLTWPAEYSAARDALQEVPIECRIASWDYELNQGVAPAVIVVPLGIDYEHVDGIGIGQQGLEPPLRTARVELVVVSPDAGSGQTATAEDALHYLGALDRALRMFNQALIDRAAGAEARYFPEGMRAESVRTAYHETYRNLAEAEVPEASLVVDVRLPMRSP